MQDHWAEVNKKTIHLPCFRTHHKPERIIFLPLAKASKVQRGPQTYVVPWGLWELRIRKNHNTIIRKTEQRANKYVSHELLCLVLSCKKINTLTKKTPKTHPNHSSVLWGSTFILNRQMGYLKICCEWCSQFALTWHYDREYRQIQLQHYTGMLVSNLRVSNFF